MKKYKIDLIGIYIYYAQLLNGLKVYMIPDNKANKTYVTLTTKYGSIHNEFIPYNQKDFVKSPHGIAHFLEHQMFEDEKEISVMETFRKNGASPNAYTYFNHTAYVFSTTEKLTENINTLLDMVYKLTIDDKTVEKEKGIIEQEINMYKDMPNFILFDSINETVFKNDLRKFNIAGTVADIKKITKEDITTCYNTFYNPNNMFMIITGKFNPKTVFEVIKNNLSDKKIKKEENIILKSITEPPTIAIKELEKMTLVENPKLSYNVKIKYNEKYEKWEFGLYLSIILEKLFGSISVLNEELKKTGVIDNDLIPIFTNADDYLIFSLICETRQKDLTLKMVENALTNIEVTKDEFEMIKKLIISNYIRLFDDVKHLNEAMIRSLIEFGDFNPEIIVNIKHLEKEKLDDIINTLNLKNKSVVYIKNKE